MLSACLVPLLIGAMPWSNELLGNPAIWTDAMNGALVSSHAGALRVQIAPGRTWAIAAIPAVTLPERVATVRVKVTSLARGKWLMRLQGRLTRGGQATTVGLWDPTEGAGEFTIRIDARLLATGLEAVQLQLGLEGQAGDTAEFGSLTFETDPARPPRTPQPGQIDLEAVELMPDLPQPYRMLDWAQKARDFDALVFDEQAKGEYLPFIWLDTSRVNVDFPVFGLPSYVGSEHHGSDHEGITTMASVLGASLCGVDKRRGPHDWVAMCEGYFNRKNGQNVVLNRTSTGSGGSFWYDLWPGMLFTMLADRYRDQPRFAEIVRTQADRWAEVVTALSDRDGHADFNHTGYDLLARRAIDNGQWREPDAAAGIAWLEYVAWRRFGDPKHFEAAHSCLDFLERQTASPFYEVLLPWGALTAAKMNAEAGTHYDVEKLVNWCFGPDNVRGHWGVMTTRWGDDDCAGLVGSVTGHGGYAFAMNTFATAAALVPLVRYDPRFARAIGKWMLNLSNAARLYYPRELPPEHQSSPAWRGDPAGAIPYEGLRQWSCGQSPYACGDPVEQHWGPKTDLGLYGGAHVGLLGAIVHTTDVAGVLALDPSATDFGAVAGKGREWLVYNPLPVAQVVTVDVGGGRTEQVRVGPNEAVVLQPVAAPAR